MKIIALSDLHIDRGDYHRQRAERIIPEIVSSGADILIFGGDMAKTKHEIRNGLEKFSEFKGIKLAYLGNHDLFAIENSFVGEHYEEMSELFSEHGFHLLDNKPFVLNNTAFVGNIGFSDYSFYRGAELNEAIQSYNNYFTKCFRIKNIKTPLEMNSHCIARIKNHLNEVSSCEKIVLGIHHVPFQELLIYGYSLNNDRKNAGMGSPLLGEFFENPKIILGLCGHTHRIGRIAKYGKIIYNISVHENQLFLKLEI